VDFLFQWSDILKEVALFFLIKKQLQSWALIEELSYEVRLKQEISLSIYIDLELQYLLELEFILELQLSYSFIVLFVELLHSF